MEKKLFNEHFIGITLTNFIVYLICYLLMVIMAVITQNTLHVSLNQTGLASGIYIIGALLARLLVEKQLELFGWKFILGSGAIFYLLLTLAYSYIPTIGALYLVRFLNGFGYGIVSITTNVIVTAYIPASKKGEGINYYGLSTSLAAAVGPFLGMILLNMTDFRLIIWFSIVLVFFVTIACLIFLVKNTPSFKEQKISLRLRSVSSFTERKALFITRIVFSMGLSYSSVLPFLSSHIEAIHLVIAGSLFFVVYALVIILTRPLTGRIFDVKGEQYVMHLSHLFLTAGLFLLNVMTNSVTPSISGTLVGLGYGTLMSNGRAVCLKIVREHRVSTVLSTYFVGLDLGLGVGSYLMGMLKSLISFKGLYVIVGVIPLVCTALYLVNGRKYSHEAEGESTESLRNEIRS